MGGTERREGGGPVQGGASTSALVERFLGELASARSGVAFVYRVLDAVTSEWDLRDAVAVLDEPSIGRQVFLPGRRVPDSKWSRWHAAHARAGIHTDPAVVDAAGDMASLGDLCRVAMRLDLARYDALHDSLTGLYNRRSFDDLLAQAVGRARRYGWRFSLVLVDLDNFKRLNDRFGHETGDVVLRTVGIEMRRVLRRGDVAARLGGDEFGLILPAAEADLVPVLVDRLSRNVTAAAPTAVGFSTGVAHCPEDGEDDGALRRTADERLYQAKVR